MKPFASHFARRLSEYVHLRRALGYKFQEADFLCKFDQFVSAQGHTGPLTQELALAFAGASPRINSNGRAQRYQVVRRFAQYLSVYEADTALLDPKALTRSNTRPPAQIFGDEELGRLLEGALRYDRGHSLAGITVWSMTGLVASTGLRIGELVRLDKADVDLETGVLTVRQTKFGKSRLVPVHPTTVEILRRYASLRDSHFRAPCSECTAFFFNWRGRRFLINTLEGIFRRVASRAGLRSEHGKGPNFHSLRHRFAVARLLRWYRQGVDVQAMLPWLATYMGHVHYTDTAYYITGTPELLALAARPRQQKRGPDETAQI
jgi:integrase